MAGRGWARKWTVDTHEFDGVLGSVGVGGVHCVCHGAAASVCLGEDVCGDDLAQRFECCFICLACHFWCFVCLVLCSFVWCFVVSLVFVLFLCVSTVALEYLEKTNRDMDEIRRDMALAKYAPLKFLDYLKNRKVDPQSPPNNAPGFPESFGVAERDEYNLRWAHSNWAGASGDDSVIISLDSLLGALCVAGLPGPDADGKIPAEGFDDVDGKVWFELVERAVLHKGDNDSTGTIAAAWYGALFGLTHVPARFYHELEKFDRLVAAGDALLK